MRPNDRFLSIALKCMLLEKHAHRAYKLAEIRMHKPFRCLDLSSGAWYMFRLITFCISNGYEC